MSTPETASSLLQERLSPWVMAARPRTLTAAVVPVVVGLAIAAESGRIKVVTALATLVAAILIQIGTNLANDYYDFVSGADTETRLGPTRVVQAGLIEPAVVRNAAFYALGAAALIGVYLVFAGGWPILAIGVFSIIAALAYSAGPWPLAYNGMGDLFVFVFFGIIAVNGTVFLQTGSISAFSIMASIAIACLATAILVVNNLRDLATDKIAGKHTLAVRFGVRFARAEYRVLMGVALLMPITLAGYDGSRLLLPLLTVPLGIRHIRNVYRRTPAELNQSLADTAAFHAIFGLTLALAIVL